MIGYIALGLVALYVVYILWCLLRARFTKSRCCKKKVKYTFGWNYKHDGLVCTKCGMMQD